MAESRANNLLNDSPSSSDAFGAFSSHAPTLARLLMDPQLGAPFVLGVFGPWGTGKSTFMNILLGEMRKRDDSMVYPIQFLPWQFENKEEVFNALMLSVLTYLETMQRSLKGTARTATKAALDTIIGMTKQLAFMAIDSKLKNWSAGNLDLDTFVQSYQKQTIDRTRFINEFQDNFSKAVSQIFEYAGNSEGRLFIFIDDLDRCSPENAITVLETMKLFFDADHCFFIVGIDKQVVQRGIEIKYNSHDMIRGQDYLDKLIQLPFNLPVITPEALRQYAEEFLQGHRFASEAPPLLAIAADHNPRRLKRLLNSIMLVGHVLDEVDQGTETDYQKLVMLLALQVRYPTIHGLVTSSSKVSQGLLLRGGEEDWQDLTEDSKTSGDSSQQTNLSDIWFEYIDKYRADGEKSGIPLPMKQLLLSGEHILGRGAAIDNLSGYLDLLRKIRNNVADIWFDSPEDLEAHARTSNILRPDSIDFGSTMNRAAQIIMQQEASLVAGQADQEEGDEVEDETTSESDQIDATAEIEIDSDASEDQQLSDETGPLEELVARKAQIDRAALELLHKSKRKLLPLSYTAKAELQHLLIRNHKIVEDATRLPDAYYGKPKAHNLRQSEFDLDSYFGDLQWPGLWLIAIGFGTMLPGILYALWIELSRSGDFILIPEFLVPNSELIATIVKFLLVFGPPLGYGFFLLMRRSQILRWHYELKRQFYSHEYSSESSNSA